MFSLTQSSLKATRFILECLNSIDQCHIPPQLHVHIIVPRYCIRDESQLTDSNNSCAAALAINSK